jgi:hypothetical protein
MKAVQFAVFGQNKPGMFGKVCRSLSDAGVNLYAVSITSDADSGIMRIVPDNVGRTRDALKEAGFSFAETEVVMAEFDDEIGAGAGVGEKLAKAGINIEQAYASACSAVCSCGRFLLVLKVSDAEKAVEALGKSALVDLQKQ